MGRFGFQVRSCPEEARGEALELLYRRVPVVLRDRLILQVLDEDQRGEIDLSGLWIAQKRGGRIAGAMLTQPLAGKVVAVWAPEVRTTWRRGDLAAALIKEALAAFEARGFRLVQAVLDDSAGPRAGRDLEKGGMPRITELIYLERDTATSLEPAVVKPDQLRMANQSRSVWSGQVCRTSLCGVCVATLRVSPRARVSLGVTGELRGKSGHARARRCSFAG